MCQFIWLQFVVLYSTFHTGIASVSQSRPATSTDDVQTRSCQFSKGLHTNLIRFITGEGFHRDLEDTLEVTVTTSSIPIKAFTSGECTFGLLHELSNDVFVDPYEIQRNPALSNYIRVLNNWTDLEGPAWHAKSNSTVFIHLKPILTGNLISTEITPIPIHYRYQLPQSHSQRSAKTETPGRVTPLGYVTVTLPLPDVILRCNYWDVTTVEEQCKTKSVICHRKAPLDGKCPWVLIPYRSNLKSGSVDIPVGDTDSTLLITVVTIGVVVCGMGLLVVTLINMKKQLDKDNSSGPHSKSE